MDEDRSLAIGEPRPDGVGTYALLLRCRKTARLRVGRWGTLEAQPGYYLYIGSAFGPGGLRARLARHCRSAKRTHWHIDYLRPITAIQAIWLCPSDEHLEHNWARTLSNDRILTPISGFGCSDCRCESHLFYTADGHKLEGCRRALRGSVSKVKGC